MYIIKIQSEDFSFNSEYLSFNSAKSGAIVSFVGKVKDFNQSTSLRAIYLDCYQKMAYHQLELIAKEAIDKFSVNQIKIIHRYGEILANEQIVLILVASIHRQEAFAACAFIIDYLKIKAPFFKKEISVDQQVIWL